jgi:hypothetical protein
MRHFRLQFGVTFITPGVHGLCANIIERVSLFLIPLILTFSHPGEGTLSQSHSKLDSPIRRVIGVLSSDQTTKLGQYRPPASARRWRRLRGGERDV